VAVHRNDVERGALELRAQDDAALGAQEGQRGEAELGLHGLLGERGREGPARDEQRAEAIDERRRGALGRGGLLRHLRGAREANGPELLLALLLLREPALPAERLSEVAEGLARERGLVALALRFGDGQALFELRLRGLGLAERRGEERALAEGVRKVEHELA